MAQHGRGAEPVHAVDRALYAQRSLTTLVQDVLQQRRRREVLPDHLIDVRIAGHQRAIGMEHRNGGARSRCNGRKEFLVVDRVDPPRHHAQKDPVLSVQPMGDDGLQFALDKALNGFRQNRFRLRIGFERLEIGSLGDVERGRRQGTRPVDQFAFRIEQRNVAEIGQALVLQDPVRFVARHSLPERLQ